MRIAYRKFFASTVCLAMLCPASLLLAQEIRVKHILVGSEAEAKDVRAEVVKNGATRVAFTKAARAHSKDTTTRLLGGDLGFVSEGDGLDKVFLTTAFDLEPGSMSEPVQTSFGWHLIYVVERRGPPRVPLLELPSNPTPKNDDGAKPASDGSGDAHNHVHTAGDGHDHDHDHDHDHPHPHPQDPPSVKATPENEIVPTAATTTAGTITPVAADRPVPKRRTLLERSFRVRLETVNSARHFPRHFMYQPEEALEVNVSVKNESSTDQSFPAPELLPLGLVVKKSGAFLPLAADFSSVAEPASFVTTLKTYQLVGYEVNISEFFPDVQDGRFTLNWDAKTFFENLETRFPKAKEAPDYESLKASLTAVRPRNPITQDIVMRDRSQRVRVRERNGMDLAVFENMRPTKKYYARLMVQGESDPVVIELQTGKQFRAAKHFADLVLEGFYDQLNFFEVRDGDYLLGGDPLSNGTGAPARLLTTRNIGKLPHKRGTVSFVSRSVRGQGPVSGGQVGSIFFVALKDHPEWDEEHVPFGEVIAGLNVLEKQGGKQTVRFQEITILDESQFGQLDVPSVAASAAAGDDGAFTTGNPELTIKTSKGDLSVELFEDTSRNTVASFIRLTEKGFYNGRKFYHVLMDRAGTERMAIQVGSPSDNFEGGPGYNIPDEFVARRRHVLGALVMIRKYDPNTESYVGDSAGSQFMICLRDIPAYDAAGFTVFGQVTGGLDVLGKLEVDDAIEAVNIDKKKNRPYTFRKS